MRKTLILTASVACIASMFLAASAAYSKPVSKTASAGPYTIILKVLSAESFSGPNAKMVRDAGAKPIMLNSTPKPDHHMVVFVKRNGMPVEDARVSIRYQEFKPQTTGWTDLPVTRMYVSGMGAKTTHYGNNLVLGAGSYKVLVSVNGKGPEQFTFTLPVAGS